MQPSEIIKTVRWLDSLFDSKTLQFFNPSISSKTDDSDKADRVFKAADRVAEVRSIVKSNKLAVKILNYFKLDSLLSTEFIEEVLRSLRTDGSERTELNIFEVPFRYSKMLEFADDLEVLVIPEALKNEEELQNVITLDMCREEGQNIFATELSDVISNIELLYNTIARVYETEIGKGLEIVHVQSGSDLNVNLKGLGEPIRALKEFVLEVWDRKRFDPYERTRQKNKTIVESLHVAKHIKLREKEGTITSQEAEKLRLQLMRGVDVLFENGAKISDIPDEETINNLELLNQFSPKQITGPEPEEETDEGSAKKKAQPKTQNLSSVQQNPKQRSHSFLARLLILLYIFKLFVPLPAI